MVELSSTGRPHETPRALSVFRIRRRDGRGRYSPHGTSSAESLPLFMESLPCGFPSALLRWTLTGPTDKQLVAEATRLLPHLPTAAFSFLHKGNPPEKWADPHGPPELMYYTISRQIKQTIARLPQKTNLPCWRVQRKWSKKPMKRRLMANSQ